MREQVRRRLVPQRLMWPVVIVKVEIVLQRREQVLAGGEVAGIDQLVLERAPQPLDENVVQCAASPIHTDGDPALLQRRQEVGGGKLRALIGVPDFGLAEAECRVKRGQAEAGFHRIGQLPTEHVTAEPIHHCDQVEKAATHRNIRNIGAPDVIWSFDGDAAQQVRIDFVTRCRTAQVGFYLGAKWKGPVTSGLQSIIHRREWEKSRVAESKAALVAYNRDDCIALETVTSHLTQIIRDAKSRADVEFPDKPKQIASVKGVEIHGSFESLLKSAHSRYVSSRIKLSPRKTTQPLSPEKKKVKRRPRRRSFSSIKGKIVRVPRRRICPA